MLGNRREQLLAGAVVFVGAVLRLGDLSAESLTSDEMYSIHFVRNYAPVEFLAQYPTIDPHPPLYYLVLDAWTTVFGVSELAARFPAAAFGVATVATTYLLGRRTFDSRVGLVAATLVALSTLHLYHSQEVRMYSLLTLVTVLSTYFFVGAVESADRNATVLYVVSTVVLLYTHVFGAFVVLSQVLFVAIDRRAAIANRDVAGLRRWGLAYAAIGLFYLPLVALVLQQVLLVQDSGVFISWIERPSVTAVPRAFLTYVGYQSETVLLLARATPFLLLLAVPVLWLGYARLAPSRSIPVVGDGAVSSGTRDSEREREERGASQQSWILLFTLLVGSVHVVPWLLSYLVTPIYVARYTISASIGAYLLAAVGLWMLVDGVEWPSIRDQHVAAALVAVLVVALVVPVGAYYAEDQRDQWRDSVDYVDERADGDDVVLVVSDSPDLADLGVVYRHYAERADARVVPIGSKNASYYDRVGALSPEYDRVWLMVGLSHSVTEGERQRFVDVLSADCEPAEERRYTGVALRVFDCAASG